MEFVVRTATWSFRDGESVFRVLDTYKVSEVMHAFFIGYEI